MYLAKSTKYKKYVPYKSWQQKKEEADTETFIKHCEQGGHEHTTIETGVGMIIVYTLIAYFAVKAYGYIAQQFEIATYYFGKK